MQQQLKKIEQKDRLERNFLDMREVRVLVSELKSAENPSYLDLALFLIGLSDGWILCIDG